MTLVKRKNNLWFPSMLDEFLKPDWLGGMENLGVNIPAVNIKETDTQFVLELAAPGKKKEDFHVEVDDNVLTISSETQTEHTEENKEERYTRKEFGFSSFKRSFTLPESVNEYEIEAGYKDGVLTLTLPKREEALPKPKRMIEIE